MLNCTVTCRGTDKKPCDNNLNVEPAGKLISNIDFGGDAMNKFFADNSSLAHSLEVAVDVSKSLEYPSSRRLWVNILPLCRATGTDRRVNSVEVLRDYAEPSRKCHFRKVQRIDGEYPSTNTRHPHICFSMCIAA